MLVNAEITPSYGGNLRPTPVAPNVLSAQARPGSSADSGRIPPRGLKFSRNFRRIAKGFIKLFKIHFAAKRRQAAPSSERTGLGHVRIRHPCKAPSAGIRGGQSPGPSKIRNGLSRFRSDSGTDRTVRPSIDLPATKAIAGNPPSFYGGRRLPAPDHASVPNAKRPKTPPSGSLSPASPSGYKRGCRNRSDILPCVSCAGQDSRRPPSYNRLRSSSPCSS